jgi:hypothetical protein
VPRILATILKESVVAGMFVPPRPVWVERMNRAIKEATVQRYHCEPHDQLEAHLANFINACNYAWRPRP